MLIEIAWFAHRAVWHLIFGGVLERQAKLRIVLTEQGTGWIPRGLDTLDWFHRRMTMGGAAETVFFGTVAKQMSLGETSSHSPRAPSSAEAEAGASLPRRLAITRDARWNPGDSTVYGCEIDNAEMWGRRGYGTIPAGQRVGKHPTIEITW